MIQWHNIEQTLRPLIEKMEKEAYQRGKEDKGRGEMEWIFKDIMIIGEKAKDGDHIFMKKGNEIIYVGKINYWQSFGTT